MVLQSIELDVGHDPGAADKVVNGEDLACEQVPCFLAHSPEFVEAELNGVKRLRNIGVNMSTSNTRHSAFRRRNMIFRVSASRGSNATCQIRQEMRYLRGHIPLPQLSSDPESA